MEAKASAQQEENSPLVMHAVVADFSRQLACLAGLAVQQMSLDALARGGLALCANSDVPRCVPHAHRQCCSSSASRLQQRVFSLADCARFFSPSSERAEEDARTARLISEVPDWKSEPSRDCAVWANSVGHPAAMQRSIENCPQSVLLRPSSRLAASSRLPAATANQLVASPSAGPCLARPRGRPTVCAKRSSPPAAVGPPNLHKVGLQAEGPSPPPSPGHCRAAPPHQTNDGATKRSHRGTDLGHQSQAAPQACLTFLQLAPRPPASFPASTAPPRSAASNTRSGQQRPPNGFAIPMPPSERCRDALWLRRAGPWSPPHSLPKSRFVAAPPPACCSTVGGARRLQPEPSPDTRRLHFPRSHHWTADSDTPGVA
mmetsp:Transcript_49879/g.132499  ORF Transcript_49879/g.132499 Transcript_49879/m.132499 type:complete len:374 (+) Transcript_49879:929-2050(+)